MKLVIGAQGSSAFLSGLESEDPKRIGLLGIGMSGWFVQGSLDVNFAWGAEIISFFAGAMIHPQCNP